jgi:hypothetical protein
MSHNVGPQRQLRLTERHVNNCDSEQQYPHRRNLGMPSAVSGPGRNHRKQRRRPSIQNGRRPRKGHVHNKRAAVFRERGGVHTARRAIMASTNDPLFILIIVFHHDASRRLWGGQSICCWCGNKKINNSRNLIFFFFLLLSSSGARHHGALRSDTSWKCAVGLAKTYVVWGSRSTVPRTEVHAFGVLRCCYGIASLLSDGCWFSSIGTDGRYDTSHEHGLHTYQYVIILVLSNANAVFYR